MAVGPANLPRGGQQRAPRLDLQEQLEPAFADDEPTGVLEPRLGPQLEGWQ